MKIKNNEIDKISPRPSPFRMLAHYNRICQQDVSLFSDPSVCARLYLFRGLGWFNEGDYEMALGYYQEAIKLDPEKILYHILYHKTKARVNCEMSFVKTLGEFEPYFSYKKKFQGNNKQAAFLYYQIVKILVSSLEQEILSKDELYPLIHRLYKEILRLDFSDVYRYKFRFIREKCEPPGWKPPEPKINRPAR